MVTSEVRHPLWHAAGWWLSLVAAVWLFGWLGQGALATPPLGDLAALREWQQQRAAPEVVFAVLRLGVLVLAWYLLGVITVGMAARLMGAFRVVALADLVTVPAVRRLLQQALGVGLAAAAVVSMPGMPAGSSRPGAGAPAHEHGFALGVIAAPPVVWSEGLDPASPGVALPIDGPDRLPGREAGARPDTEAGAGTSAEPEVGPGAETGIETGAEPDVETRPESILPVPPTPVDAVDAEWPADHTIAAGEHLWSVAEEALAAAWDRDPTDDEVSAYWREMIDHNRDGLPDPANPDLVHPGLRIELPAPPAP